MICHFGDKFLQAVDCTGVNNQTVTKRKYTKRTKTCHQQLKAQFHCTVSASQSIKR